MTRVINNIDCNATNSTRIKNAIIILLEHSEAPTPCVLQAFCTYSAERVITILFQKVIKYRLRQYIKTSVFNYWLVS